MSTVLVIDDEPGMRTALQANFLRHGWSVRTASGVNEAVSALARIDFDLVISDIRMRDGDGFEVLNILRRDSPLTAVILLTAFGSVPEAVMSMRSGAFDYLTKPVSFDQLQATATRVMQRVSDQQKPLTRISDVERQHLENILALTRGNRTHTAEMLGISLRTVRNRIKQYGLPPRSYA
jgi:DNA-binding NtrC family response regulator